jgi:putative N-acetylmannosamine-6-phosphate epimerase
MIAGLQGKLIVSCQATPEEPLHGTHFMAAMAQAARMGGAGGIRANGVDDIAAIRQVVDLPIIGINKRHVDGSDVYITPAFEDAAGVVRAGAHLVALDGTARARPDALLLTDLIARIHDDLNVPVMADCSCMEDAATSASAGADILATTLSGYTAHGNLPQEGPDLELVSQLVARFSLPVIAEGRFSTPQQVGEAFARGAYAVVVGGAITRPQEITRRFVRALPSNLV